MFLSCWALTTATFYTLWMFAFHSSCPSVFWDMRLSVNIWTEHFIKLQTGLQKPINWDLNVSQWVGKCIKAGLQETDILLVNEQRLGSRYWLASRQSSWHFTITTIKKAFIQKWMKNVIIYSPPTSLHILSVAHKLSEVFLKSNKSVMYGNALTGNISNL